MSSRMDRQIVWLAAAAASIAAPLVAAAGPPDPGTGGDAGSSTPVVSERDLIDADILDDPTVSLTSDGLLVSEPPQVGPFLPLTALDEIDAAPAGSDGPVPLAAETGSFELHSRPDAGLVIHLDFDGHTTSGTSWNSSKGIDPIVSAPYSVDGDAAFSAQELDYIAKVWSMVSEDFAPFDVDVTTEDPGVAALSRSGQGDTEYGLRIVISPTSSWYGSSGGVAYINSFWASSDRPAFVFSNHLSGGYWKPVAEAASHEAGHGLGLYHDGLSGGTSYYAGHGDWAPIMGVGYSRRISQWSKGEYSGASNTSQDDVAIIGAALGLIPTPGSTALTDGDSVVGTIVAAGGDNEFTFVTDNTEQVEIVVRPTLAHHNLLARVDVYDSGGGVVASATPTDDAGWVDTLSTQVGSGTYRVVVTGIGWLNPLSSGFSDYASLGQFVLEFALDDPGTTTTTTTTAPPTTTSTTTTSTVPPGPEAQQGDRLTAIGSTRLMDTRSGPRGPTRLRAGETVILGVAGRGATPSTATAAVLNAAAVDPAADGFISLTTCDHGSGVPPTSTLNFKAGSNTANSSIVTLDPFGDVCIYSSAETDVIVDMTAWLGEEGSTAMGAIVRSRRAVDSRLGTGGITRLTAGTPITIDLTGHIGPTATAAAVNITVDRTAGVGFVSAYLCEHGWDQNSSALNHGPGETRANNAILALGPDQTFCVLASAETDIIIDVTAEFSPAGTLTYVPREAVRVLDTRGGEPLAGGTELSFKVPAAPAGFGPVRAASLVVTAVGQTEHGFVSAWGCGPRPGTSTLNPRPLTDTPNGAIVGVGTGQRSCLFTLNETELIVDFSGWWI
jgi:hypothetical protein